MAQPGKRGQRPGAKRAAREAAGYEPATKRSEHKESERKAFAERARAHTTLLGVQTRSYGHYVVDSADVKLGRSLIVKRTRPEFRMLDRTVAVIRRLLGEDTARGQFVDVGANIGTETVPALLRHGFSAAVCVEPDPNNHRLLRSNLVLNAVDDKAVALQMGASDHCGASTLARVPQSGGNSYIVVDVDAWHELHAQKPATSPATGNGSAAPRTPVERGHSGEELTPVEITTLDALADQEIIDPEKAGLLWIDAEGHEGHVLAGATCLTGRGTPILVEYFPESIAIRGDLERFDAVLDQYTHFIDIRRRAAAKTASHRLRPISEMPTVTASLRDPEQSGFTDLLLLRLDEHQAARGSDVRAF